MALVSIAGTGVEVTFGPAPAGSTHVRLRDGHEWFVVRVQEEAFWLVRWNLTQSEDDEDDAGDLELVGFLPEKLACW